MLLSVVALLGLFAAGPAVLIPRDDAASSVARPARDSLLNTSGVKKLNGESCTTSSECRDDRLCIVEYSAETSIPYVCDSPDKDCICLRADFLSRRCTTSTRCDVGERCFHKGGADGGAAVGLCYSCDAFDALQKRDKKVEPVDDGNCDGEVEQKPSATVPKEGLNGDKCTKSDECAGNRDCIVEYSANTSIPYVCDSPAKDCICLRSDYLARRCTGSARCDAGERCFKPGDAEVGLCYSCDALKGVKGVENVDGGNCDGKLTAAGGSSSANTGGDSGGSGAGPAKPAPCIAVHHLQHLPRGSLVFRQHIEADVLCDAAGSCATHGHVVVFEGAPMMMGTYCAQHAACERARMLVNSPRMGARALRVASKTAGLQYTVYAARYESALEERVLRALVRAGL